LKFGAHQSIQGGFARSIDRALTDNCSSLQIFTKAPSMWKAKPIADSDAGDFRTTRESAGIGPIVVHDSYLINPCAEKDELRAKSWNGLLEEGGRTEKLGIEYLVLHPGALGSLPENEGLELVAGCIDQVLAATGNLTILLETTAGQGTSIGHRFEQLAAIIELSQHPDRVQVCFDTCHVFAAGYDLRTTGKAKSVFAEFDSVIGLDRLAAFHLNDSKKELGTRVDRHALIGKGHIGIELFRYLANEPRFAHTPGILETPIPKGDTYRNEVLLLQSLVQS